MSRATKGQWLIKDVSNFSDKLNLALNRFEQENVGLRQFCAETIFDAIFNTVFGQSDRNAPFNPLRTYKNFEYYHKYFNYMWLGLPKKFMPGIMDTLCDMCQQPSAEELLSREDCSEYIKRGIRHLLENGQTEADVIGHNLVMLHVNYNTFRMAFWVLYYLLRDAEAWKHLSEEIEELSDKTSLSTGDVDRLRVLDSIVQESARLSSGVFMVRYVTEDTMFKTPDNKEFLIRKGDRVAMYPPAIHKDPNIFADPLKFQFDRFISKVFYKDGEIVKNPVMPFGTICPGKRLALLQLKLFIINVVSNFDVKLNDGETTELDNTYHGHEVLPPTNDVQMTIKRKRENLSSLGCFS
ncbi:DgyrCDS4559 [Dimorphilus gyrociliatus]|uniref:DgyrCDS4559 n=1 Tax=Dimorphilus gyrociliatus TaxID=2664684 RepID=A0A7I8VHE2_9ANNE|nr:DgyrCDS4559 [Dimorphilus gyrociliatus]